MKIVNFITGFIIAVFPVFWVSFALVGSVGLLIFRGNTLLLSIFTFGVSVIITVMLSIILGMALGNSLVKGGGNALVARVLALVIVVGTICFTIFVATHLSMLTTVLPAPVPTNSGS